jgi:hypothetical protein
LFFCGILLSFYQLKDFNNQDSTYKYAKEILELKTKSSQGNHSKLEAIQKAKKNNLI